MVRVNKWIENVNYFIHTLSKGNLVFSIQYVMVPNSFFSKIHCFLDCVHLNDILPWFLTLQYFVKVPQLFVYSSHFIPPFATTTNHLLQACSRWKSQKRIRQLVWRTEATDRKTIVCTERTISNWKLTLLHFLVIMICSYSPWKQALVYNSPGSVEHGSFSNFFWL